MTDLDIPIALRRSRRNDVRVGKQEEPAAAIPTPKTPHRHRKRARNSDPGPSAIYNSGLTPMIRRTTIDTSRKCRRASTPARFSTRKEVGPHHSLCHDHRHFSSNSLHKTFDGRVERRLRRNNLRDLLNKLEKEKRHTALQTKSEISHLKSEIKSRDREIYELQNATMAIDTERIYDLEQQIESLKAELAQGPETPRGHTRSYNWTAAAQHPFADDYADMDMMAEDDQFGDATVGQFVASTPSRARSSFPTPPATSPMFPGTPHSRECFPTPRSHAGVQVTFPSPGKQQMEEELASLHLEVCKLTTTLDSYKNMGARLKEQLISVAATSPLSDDASTADVLHGKVEALLQDVADRTAAVTHLSAMVSNLGFPGMDARQMITSLAAGFRAARLELEYLTPGEIALPLTSHGAEVLDLLLTRLRELAQQVKEDEATIDEYHEIEQSLRKQLDARVSAMDDLRSEMTKAERLLNEKTLRIQEVEISNERLKGAVNGYIRDIAELESLVERMEQEHREQAATHSAQRECDRQEMSKKDNSVAELEEKLGEAVRQTACLLKEISDVQDDSTKHIVSLNKRHGTALALRDARVLELRGEIDRVNESLRSAHETIHGLRLESGTLQTQVGKERASAKAAMDSMKAELQRVLQMSQEFLGSPKPVKKRRADCRDEMDDELASSPVCVGGEDETSRQRGRGGKKLRRRYDSGLGMLEEDEVDLF